MIMVNRQCTLRKLRSRYFDVEEEATQQEQEEQYFQSSKGLSIVWCIWKLMWIPSTSNTFSITALVGGRQKI
jgi:hypothetical protein